MSLRHRIEATTGPIRDIILTQLINIKPCCGGDHETVLPCPYCGAAI